LDVWPQQHLFLWLAAFAESLRRRHQSHDDWPRVAREQRDALDALNGLNVGIGPKRRSGVPNVA